MHASSLANMTYFRKKYLESMTGRELTVLDLGSCDINGSYRPLFDSTGWTYYGLDMAPGKNVDIVLQDPYRWREVKTNSADVLISGQAFEHMQYFWMVMLEIRRVLKPNGLCCLIAPSGGPEHRFPVDCYRFLPDGFRALASFASLETIEAFYRENGEDYEDTSHLWKDTVFIGRKPRTPLPAEKLTGLKHLVLKKLTFRGTI